MDGYPTSSLDHNVPLIVVSGLPDAAVNEISDEKLGENGVLIQSDLPALDTQGASILQQYFASLDNRQPPWKTQTAGKLYRFRAITAGRSFRLPPRRATLPEADELPESPSILHSPFSPLSPNCPLYPDGLIDSQWIQKHQDLVPSIYLCFYTLTNDLNLATLRDNQIKVDIIAVKNALRDSGYKTRVVVVLLSDDGVSAAQTIAAGVPERLENLRRGAALDSKSIFYIQPRATAKEFHQAADSILTALYPMAIEYYRDIGRHARKKRGRGIVPLPTLPPTSGTSQTLSLSGWHVRYDFKAGVLAEFRQEMDVAVRSYDQAYDELLGPDVWDAIPSWSARWNEARLLADVISIRAIRCLLWTGQTTAAVRRWQAHRDRSADFIERRGSGTTNYGWEAWESRWALAMANLVENANIEEFDPSTSILYLHPEKTAAADRLKPWELLHHTGYWYGQAARHLAARRLLARSIPDEDRTPPVASEGAAKARKGYHYDTYLCPEPYEEMPAEGLGVNHSQLIIDCLMEARAQFRDRGQIRATAQISLEIARELTQVDAWDDILVLLKPMWEDSPFRNEGWLEIVQDIAWKLRAAAVQSNIGSLVLAIDWELLNNQFTRRPDWHYDLTKSLEGMKMESSALCKLDDTSVTSFLTSAFVFRSEEGKAGEACQAQLQLSSHAHADSLPVVLSELRVEFEGNLRPIVLSHGVPDSATDDAAAARITSVPLTGATPVGDDDLPILTGRTDLELKPGRTIVLELAIPLREPGEAKATKIIALVRQDGFEIEYTMGCRDSIVADIWTRGKRQAVRKRISRVKPYSIRVHPRPPKMEIGLVDALQIGQYYVNEPIELDIQIKNAENDETLGKLDVDVAGEAVPPFSIHLGKTPNSITSGGEEPGHEGLPLEKMKSLQTVPLKISLDPPQQPGVYDVTIRIAYHLVSDPSTPIVQMATFPLNIVSPFEANYDMVPRLHPDAWPSLFDYDGSTSGDGETPGRPRGLAQKWCLTCHYASFASEDLTIAEVDAKVVSCTSNAQCTVVSRPVLPAKGLDVPPKKLHDADFDLVAQKLGLDDRGPATLDLALVIKWRRSKRPSSPLNTTTIPIPRYMVLGAEPRVLASLHEPSADRDGLILLDITLENPSSHFLTFGLTMEPSDKFAFSGAKQTTLHVLPISRRTVSYRLLPLVQGEYIRPALVVRDKYFQKVLRVIPTEGMRINKEGLLIWVPGDDEEGDELSSE